VVAIWAVVLGHWYLVAVTRVDDGLGGRNALGDLGWAPPVTWAFQVMPLFFFVGGLANAGSLARHAARGGDGLGWIVHRYRRLVVPAAALLATVATAVAGARAAGADLEVVARGAWVATVPLWFLAVYLAVVALAPLSHAAHRRWGWTVPALLVAVVGLVDATRFAGRDAWFSDAGYLVGWLAIHQVGYAWHDGRLPTRPRPAAALAGIGLVTLVGLTVVGPYPVSMVNVPGPELDNADPPTLALLALAVVQIGVVLAVRDPATRWVSRDRPRRLVGRVHGMLLTLFCWHMAAAVLAVVVLYGGGIIPVVSVGSAAWLGWRVPWLTGCAVGLALFVLLAAPLERATAAGAPGAHVGRGASGLAALVGIGAVLVGMWRIAVAGSAVHGALALPTEALITVGVGVALITVAAARATRPADRRA